MGGVHGRRVAGSGARENRPTVAGSGVLARGGNSFGLLRLVLASCVIASHTFSIGGFGREPLWTLSHRTVTLGAVAVWGFFGLSGVLVGMSAEHACADRPTCGTAPAASSLHSGCVSP